MVSPTQAKLDADILATWAADYGIGLTLFYGWETFVEQALFWADAAKPDAAVMAAQRIEARLIAVEATPTAVALWNQLLTNSSL